MLSSHQFQFSRQEIMETILDFSHIGCWEITCGESGCLIHMDPTTSAVFDLPPEETTTDFFGLISACHEKDRARIGAELQEMLQNPGMKKTIEYRVWSKKSGSWRWVRSFGKSFATGIPGEGYILGSTQDIQDGLAFQSFEDQMNEVNERAQIMLDATPLCSNFWDEDYKNIDCNQEAAKLFDLPDKKAYLENFHKLSPEYQPDGTLSSEKAARYIKEAFETGKVVFEWMHQKPDGEPIPAEITLVRVKRGEGHIVVGYTRDLREYKRMTAAMREANERTQIMLDATPLCCNLWDQNFNNIDCNEEAVKLFGLSSKQEYLERFFQLSPEFQPCGRPSSEKATGYINQAFQEGKAVFEWMHQKLDGEPVPSEITLVRVKRGDSYIVAGYTRDLREYKKMVAETSEANERTQIMLDATPLCCNLWDESFNNIDCNEEAVKLFDLSSKQEYLERFFELSPEYQPCGRSSAELAAGYITTAFQEGGVVFEWMHQKLNGEPVPSEISLVRVKRGDTYIVAGYTRDLREYKKMMAEIRQVEADLRLARDAAEDSARSKSEFLANMSHEIRTPMNAILGMLHLIQAETNSGLTPKQADYLTKAETSAKTLLRIINDILDFSKIEAGKLEMERVPFRLEDVLRQMTDLFQKSIADKGLFFHIEAQDDLPKNLMGDPLRLAQVLLNLVGNSIKFTERGGITLSLWETTRGGGKVIFQFTVKDTGIGMEEQQVKGLFSAFTQADTSTTRKYGGTGLGLAISKKLVNMMHGDIWCVSEPGVGTQFQLTVQFDLMEEDCTGPTCAPGGLAADGSLGDAPRDLASLRPILLTEDNEINQIIAEEILKMAGYRVDIANNGQEALQKLLTGDYELVLMDIQMPVMDGLTAVREIRKAERLRELPVIAMTAHAMSGDHEKSLEAGMNDHVTKPIDPEVLYATLDKWIGPRGQ